MGWTEMSWTSQDEGTIRAYLLGELADAEQTKVEERLFADPDYVELLLIVEDELVDAYVRGTLDERERQPFEAHFLAASQRRRKLRLARALRDYANRRPRRTAASTSPAGPAWWAWLRAPALRPAAAVVVLLAAVYGVWRVFIYESLAEKGRAALSAALTESPVEARISGFDWRPHRPTLGPGPDPDNNSLRRAELYLQEAVVDQPGSVSDHALGQLFLARKEFDAAIRQIEQALKEDPNSAKLHNDLGVAFLEKAKAYTEGPSPDRRAELFARGLEHFNQALTLDGSLLEALFNRALCRERMQLLHQAEADWAAYLERDAESLWADEARRRLEAIERQKNKRISQTKEEVLREFLAAYRAKDDFAAWRLLSQTREIVTGRLVWWQLLDQLFDAAAFGRLAGEEEILQALDYAGKLEAEGGTSRRNADDPFVLELARHYRSATSKRRSALSQAHAMINEANGLFLASQYNRAISLYNAAEGIYAHQGDHWEAKVAEFLIAYCYFSTRQFKRSLSTFEELAGICEKKGHRWLLAQTLNAAGSAYDALGEFSKGLANTERALQVSQDLGDAHGTQKNQAQLGDAYRKLGDFDQSSKYLSRGLQAMGDRWPGARQMWRSYDQLALLVNARHFYAAAADYEMESLRVVAEEGGESPDPARTYLSYVHLGVTRGKQGHYAEAIRLARLGYETAQTLADEGARLIHTTYASLQLGHLYRLAGDCPSAAVFYDQAIERPAALTRPAEDDTRTRQSLEAWLYDAHKGKLLCHIAQGNDATARIELENVFALAEKNRASILEERHKNTFFDVEQSLYDAAIGFAYSRLRDAQKAFEYSERSRGRSLLELMAANALVSEQEADSSVSDPLNLAEIQSRLADDAQILQYAALDDRLLIWVITKDRFSHAEVKVPLKDLTDTAINFHRSVSRRSADAATEAKELYTLLISPVESLLEKNKRICVVPDKALNHVPFNALISPASGNYLIHDYELTLSPSATVHIRCSESARRKQVRGDERLLAVGNPSFDHAAFPSAPDLPLAAVEAERIAVYYGPQALLLTGADAREDVIKQEMKRSDVVHLASHYIVDEWSPTYSKLLLAREEGATPESEMSAGVLQAGEIYGLKMGRVRLVVLSACQSGVERYYNGEGLIGMSRVFIAEGVPQVVASLWQADSYATSEMMVRFHQYRKRDGMPTAAALRQAQLDLLSDSGRTNREPYFWAPFVTIGSH